MPDNDLCVRIDLGLAYMLPDAGPLLHAFIRGLQKNAPERISQAAFRDVVFIRCYDEEEVDGLLSILSRMGIRQSHYRVVGMGRPMKRSRRQQVNHLRAYLKARCHSRMVDLVMLAWTRIEAAVPELSVPDACPGPGGEVLLVWNTQWEHMELEVFEDAPAAFFHSCAPTPEETVLWGCDYTIGDPVPDEAAARLQHFVE